MIPNRIDIVRRAKADVINAGINPDESECNRFEITKRTAVYLAAEYPEVGLLNKESGNNCENCAVDIICLSDGMIIDILGSGNEGPNTPLWIVNLNPVSPNRWRAPLPYKQAVNPVPNPEPTSTSIPIPEPSPVPEPKPEPTPIPEPTKTNKMKALAIITTAIGALTWLLHIVSRSEDR